MKKLKQMKGMKKKVKTDFDSLEKKLGVVFKNKSILRTALIHRSYRNENRKENKNNERLEFLGDAVLELIISSYIFRTFLEKPEGELTSIRSAIVRTESLAQESKKLGIGEHLLMSKGEETSGGREKEYLLADAYEAILGAIYLDSGFKTCERFVEKTLLQKVDDIMEKELFIDPKTKVQEIIQAKYKITPVYQTIDEEGPDHQKSFTVGLFVDKKRLSTGKGHSKQKAEEDAARNVLDSLEKE